MKKIVGILLCSVFLCGCIEPGKINKDTVLKDTALVTESPLPFEEEKLPEKEETGQKEEITEEQNSIVQAETEFTDEVKAELMRKQQDLYYFSTMEITQQNLYVEILYALENFIDEMQVSTTDPAQIDKVFQCVLMDHPEIFYADGYSFVKYTLGDEIKKITFKGTYIYNQEEKQQKEAEIEMAALQLLKGIEASAADYEKVKYVYETIIHNTEYDMTAEDNQNICSVFLNHASVCQGYAKAVQYLLDKLNIPSSLVIGTVENGEGHAWNLVKINNQYYYLDATWGDASYLVHLKEDSPEIQNTPAINYDYLCVTGEEIAQTHSISDLVPMPICDSLENNYYVREGAYFTEVNLAQLEQLIERYKAEGKENVTLKCGDEQVYLQMTEELLSKQKIFQYIDSENNSIMYTDSPEQRSITFWL